MRNPHAFPRTSTRTADDGGMRLLDYFAGRALPAVIRQCAGDGKPYGTAVEELFARKAYAVAEAMLDERDRRIMRGG